MPVVGEELVCEGSRNETLFDTIIGHIEDIIIDEEFIQMQNHFMEKYYQSFENCEENKLEYMEIFNEYTELVEKYIETSLIRKIPAFSMKEFLQEIMTKQSELDGEIFDILASFTDFISFKEMFLDYKAAREGNMPDLSLGNSS